MPADWESYARGQDAAADAFERACDYLLEVVLADMPEAINTTWLAEDITDRIGRRCPQEVVDAIDRAAQRWAAEKKNA